VNAPSTPAEVAGEVDGLWRRGVALLTREFSLLSAERREELGQLLADVGNIKEELCHLSDAAQGAAICAACGGACCRAGRYHVTLLDLLAFLAAGETTVEPEFAPGACPFLGCEGCRIVPRRRRPFTCVIFICDLIDERLGADETSRFSQREHDLRLLLNRAGMRFGRNLTESLLIATARNDRDGGFLLVLND
jgi:hypothetical protein